MHTIPYFPQVKGTGQQEGLTIFCPPGTTTNIDIPQISTLILSQQNNDKDDDDNNSHSTPKQQVQQVVQPLSSVPELANQQGPWTCVCGVANEEGTIRCEACFGWRENSTAVVVVDKGNTTKKPQYYTKMKHVIGQILKKENEEAQLLAQGHRRVRR